MVVTGRPRTGGFIHDIDKGHDDSVHLYLLGDLMLEGM